MPEPDDIDGLEKLVRSLADQLAQPAIRRAELTLRVAVVEALVARFEPEEIERTTHVYAAGTFAAEQQPSSIDAVGLVVNKVSFAIGQVSRAPTAEELATLEAAPPKRASTTMPRG